MTKQVERAEEWDSVNSMYQEYVKYPEVTKKRMFYETMEDVLPGLKVIIESSDGQTNTILPLDSFVKEELEETQDVTTEEE